MLKPKTAKHVENNEGDLVDNSGKSAKAKPVKRKVPSRDGLGKHAREINKRFK